MAKIEDSDSKSLGLGNHQGPISWTRSNIGVEHWLSGQLVLALAAYTCHKAMPMLSELLGKNPLCKLGDSDFKYQNFIHDSPTFLRVTSRPRKSWFFVPKKKETTLPTMIFHYNLTKTPSSFLRIFSWSLCLRYILYRLTVNCFYPGTLCSTRQLSAPTLGQPCMAVPAQPCELPRLVQLLYDLSD